MKNYLKKTKLAVMLFALGFLSVTGTGQAALFQIDYTTAGAFSGTPPPLPIPSSTVFATAVFDDGGGSGSVTLTMSVLNNLSTGAYVNDWYFNTLTAPLTSINFVSGTAASSIQTGTNAYKADGTGGNFDFAFHFPTSNPGELAQGHTSVYELIDLGLTAASFNSVSVPAPNGGDYLSALHVQGYNINGQSSSVWIGGTEGNGGESEIPEPTTLALLGLGLLGITATRRRWH